jgi:ABC-type nickel/cobalt efflux system permease component RcnA
VLLTAGLLVGLLASVPAGAHPRDEATVTHFLWVQPRQGEVSLQYAAMVGGVITPQVWPQIDRNGDGEASDEEQEAFARTLAREVRLSLDGKPLSVELTSYEIPPHDAFFGALSEIKLQLRAKSPKVGATGATLAIRDGTFARFTPVFPQPVARPDGLEAAAPEVSENGRLTRVRLRPAASKPRTASPDPQHVVSQRPTPNAQLLSPQQPTLDTQHPTEDFPLPPSLRQEADRMASTGVPDDLKQPFQIRPEFSGPRGVPQPKSVTEPLPSGTVPLIPPGKVLYARPEGTPAPHGGLDDLRETLGKPISPGLLLMALFAAVIAGGAHALTPGHGKAMVGAYLVGSRGTVWDAVLLGVVVTITHTAGVYILGALCLLLTQRFQAEAVGHWLSVASGALVLGMGFWLFQRGLLAYHGIRPMPGHSHAHADHTHAHETQIHSHEHSHVSGHALAGHAHSHEPGHAHEHALDAASERTPPADAPLEDPAAEARERGVNRWGIIGLGVAGGMVPCFDALAILIAAVNLRSVVLGLVLILAFSVGMAAVLVAIGILMVTAKDLMQRFTGEAAWVRALPAVSGAILFFLGAWLTLQSLAQVGVVKVG